MRVVAHILGDGIREEDHPPWPDAWPPPQRNDIVEVPGADWGEIVTYVVAAVRWYPEGTKAGPLTSPPYVVAELRRVV